MRKLKYNFEYCCYSIWLEENKEKPIFENISVENLSINPFLKKEIIELEHIYQSGYNENDPTESGLHDVIYRCIFYNRVLISSKLLKIELKGKYEVIFDDEDWNNKLSILKDNLNF